MKKMVVFSLFLVAWACKLPELPPPLIQLSEPSNLVLESKFILTDPMVHIGLQTAAVTNNGTIIANENEVIKVWNYNNETLLQTLKAHSELVIDMVLSRDETQLFSVGLNENNILVWDWKNGKLLKTLSGHTAQINCIRLSADGKYLASVSMDGTAKIWDVPSGNVIRTITGLDTNNPNTKVSISNGAKYVAILQGRSFVLFDGKNGAEYWRVIDKNDYGPEVIESNLMTYIGTYQDILLSGDGTVLYFDTKSLVGAWNIPDKAYKNTLISFNYPDPLSRIVTPMDIDVWKGYKSKTEPSFKTLHLTYTEKRLTYNYGVYDLSSNGNALTGAPKFNSILLSSDSSKLLFIRDNTFEIINFSESTFMGYVVEFPDLFDPGIKYHSQEIVGFNKLIASNYHLSIDKNGVILGWTNQNGYSEFQDNIFKNIKLPYKLLATQTNILAQNDTQLMVWNRSTGNKILSINTNYFSSTPAFSHNGAFLYADNKIFNSSDGSKKLDLPKIDGIVLFTSDDKQLVNVNSKGEIKVFDTIEGKQVKSFLTAGYSIYWRMTVSNAGKGLVAITNGEEVFIQSISDGKLVGSFMCKTAFTNSTTIEYNPVFDIIAIATTDRKVQLWSANTKKMLSEAKFDFDVVNVQFNENGKKLYVTTQKDFYQYNLN